MRLVAKPVHASVKRVADAAEWYAMNSAKDSFSHRSSHQRIVTRSPNHMCAISCRIVLARASLAAWVTFERKT